MNIEKRPPFRTI